MNLNTPPATSSTYPAWASLPPRPVVYSSTTRQVYDIVLTDIIADLWQQSEFEMTSTPAAENREGQR